VAGHIELLERGKQFYTVLVGKTTRMQIVEKYLQQNEIFVGPKFAI
jgi:hypothetical protein